VDNGPVSCELAKCPSVKVPDQGRLRVALVPAARVLVGDRDAKGATGLVRYLDAPSAFHVLGSLLESVASEAMEPRC
jgi:hypothetical protein